MTSVFDFKEYECWQCDRAADHHHGRNGRVVPCGGSVGSTSNHNGHCDRVDQMNIEEQGHREISGSIATRTED